MRASHLASALVVSMAAIVLAGQDQQPVFRGGVDIVQIDVSVLDKTRHPIRGLTLDAFHVLEDGKPQHVAALSEVDRPDEFAFAPVWAPAVRPDVESNAVGERRLFAIVIDDARCCRDPYALYDGRGMMRVVDPSTDPLLAERMRALAHGVIDRLQPGDMAAVIFTRNALHHQAFTEDRDSLHAAVDTYTPFDERPIQPRPIDKAIPSPARGVDVLAEVAQYLGRVPLRRKSLVFISIGGPQPTRGYSSGVTDAIAYAQRANVNIYPIDPEVFVRTSGTGLRRSNPRDLLNDLAVNTGGLAIITPQSFDAALDQMFVENDSYYVVGYQSANPQADGKFRRLEVKVDGQDVALVRARSTVLRPKLERRDGTANGEKLSAGLSPDLRDLLPGMDVEFHATAVPVLQPDASKYPVAIVAGLAESVPAGVTRIVERMDVETTAYDDRGDIRGSVRQSAHVDLPEDGSRVRYEVLERLDLAPGHYSLRVVAHNADNDKVGSVEFPVDVPDAARNPIALSGISLSTDEAPIALPDAALFKSVLVPRPTATRDFQRTSHASAFMTIARNSPQVPAVHLNVRLLDGRGATVVDASRTVAGDGFDQSNLATERFEIPFERLESGWYLLSVSASASGRTTPQRDVTLRVR